MEYTAIKSILSHEIVKTNGIHLNVVQAGPEDGELVILLHGFPEFWYGWHKQIDALVNEGYRLWIPDQRGYNLSHKPEGLEAYRISEMATDVAGLIEAAGQEQAVVIGHDWGAMVAWWTALLYPEKLTKLGVLNVPHPAALKETIKTDVEQMFRSLYAGFFQIPVVAELTLQFNNYQNMIEALKRSGKAGTFTEEDFKHYRRAWSQPSALTTMLNWYRAYVQHPPLDAADWRIDIPTLMIWGEKDVALTSKMAHKSINYCNVGELHMLPEATHWVQHDEPEQVNQLISAFLKREYPLSTTTA